nr:FecR domain-containing protein [Desulfobulbaceae bacterium]
MKRSVLLLSLLIFLCLATAAQSETNTHVANIKNLTGSVSIVRDTVRLAAELGQQLFSADTIISSADSSAGILFTDGTSVSIGPASEVNITNYLFQPNNNEYDFSLYMNRGSALYSNGKLGKLSPESVKIHTPRATVGVRGTRFIVKVD